MANKGWIEAHGLLDREIRAAWVKQMRRIRTWGNVMILAAAGCFLFVMLWEPLEDAHDAYGLAVAFASLIAAGFTLTAKADTETKLCEILDEMKP